MPTRVRPLHVRPGTRFDCFGDGVCCTDIHGLGPLKRRELPVLRMIAPEVVTRQRESEAYVLQVGSEGACLFLAEGACQLHAALGPQGKPSSCQRFPLGLTATPRGGRITTDHRCPCRTMGARPELTPEQAEPSLQDAAGRLRAERRAPSLIALRRGERVAFERWERMEQELLDRLARGDDPAEVLGATPFPELEGASWKQAASEMQELEQDALTERGRATRFETALAWFADGVMALCEDSAPPPRERPWSPGFDRAEARSPEPGDPRTVVADWVADEVWSLRWTLFGPFSLLKAELGTRVAVAGAIARRLQEQGVRADRAAAEAVMIADLTGTSSWWTELMRRMRE